MSFQLRSDLCSYVPTLRMNVRCGSEADITQARAEVRFGDALGGLRVVRHEPLHHSLLVKLGTHVEHGLSEAARDFGDSVRRKLVENADAHLNGLRQRRPDTEAVRSASRDEILLFACE